MDKFHGIWVFTIFILSVVVHLLTYIPIPIPMIVAFPFQILALAALGMMALREKDIIKDQPWLRPVFCRGNKLFHPYLSLRYDHIKTFIGCYAVLICCYSWFKTWAGMPAEVNGHYEIVKRGVTVREISKAEYQQFEAYWLRGFSIMWILFTYVSTLFFLKVIPALKKEAQDAANGIRSKQ
jgi:hypothetical protein